MKKVIIVFFVLVAFSLVALYFINSYVPNKRSTYYGTVTDITGKPIEGAIIELVAKDWEDEEAVTDIDGKFILRTNMHLEKITAKKEWYKFLYDRDYLKNPHNFIGEKTP